MYVYVYIYIYRERERERRTYIDNDNDNSMVCRYYCSNIVICIVIKIGIAQLGLRLSRLEYIA